MKILYVEDELAHVLLTQRTLEENIQLEFTLAHAETIREALSILDTQSDFDLILSDLRLPDGTGLDLLKKVRERPAAPAVVLVTGQGEQEDAVAALKAGAADYLVKQSDYLHRLPIVITNAIAQNRYLREQVALQEAEVRYRSLVEQLPAVVFLDKANEEEATFYMSPRIEELTGYTPEEWYKVPDIWSNSIHPADRARIDRAYAKSHVDKTPFFEEYRFIRRDGRTIWIKEDTNLIRDKDGNPLYWQGILLDITQEKENEAALQRQLRELSVLHSVAVASSESYSEDEIIERVIKITGQIYPEVCGILQLNDKGDILTPHPSYLGADVSNWSAGYPITQGITGKAIRLEKAMRVNDITEEAEYIEIASGIRSELCVPIRVNKRMMGVLNVESRSPNAFGENDERLLNTIASSLGTALERLRLFKEERRRRQEAETLRQAASVISSTIDLNHVMEYILKALKQVMDFDSASIFLHEGDWLRLAVCQGFAEPEKFINRKYPAEDELFHQVREARKPIIITDVQIDRRFSNWAGTTQIRGWMAIPLLQRGRIIGYITLDNHKAAAYDESNIETAMAFAYQAAAAIENARLYDESQRRLTELEALNRLSSSLRITHAVDEMLEILLDETLNLINTEHGAIWLYDPNEEKLVQRTARGLPVDFKVKAFGAGSESIIGHVFLSGKAHVSPELASDPRASQRNRDITPPGSGGVGIPIHSTAGAIGVLMILLEPRHQILDQINLLTTLAEIAGNSIHRAQLFENNREQIRRLTTLRDIDAAIASSFDLRLTLNILMDQTIKHLGVHAIDICLYQPDLQIITYLGSLGFQSTSVTRPLVRIGEGLAGQVIIRHKTFHITDLQNSPEIKHDPMLKREGFVTYIGIPLIVKGQIKGVFEIFHRASLLPTPEWMEFLHTLAGQAAIAIDNSQLFENLQRSNQELIQAYDTTLEGWARALEIRDRETEGHTRRVTELTLRLAQYMGIRDSEMINIHRGVLLHDIGKMGVPDHILKKTSELDPSEWEEMRQHPVYAYNLLAPISYLRGALDIPYCHHEHWDGSGYPRGLKGEQIPLAARIFSVVDVWDALLSDRPYRLAWPRNEVIAYLRKITGTYLDPAIVEVFLKMISEDEVETE